jgi:hypothetical protein
MFEDCLDVPLLTVGLGPNGAALGIDLDLTLSALTEHIACAVDGVTDIIGTQPILPAELPLHLLKNRGRLADLFPFATQSELIVTVDDPYTEGLPD